MTALRQKIVCRVRQSIRGFGLNPDGSVTGLVAFFLLAFLSMVGLVAQEAILYQTQTALQSAAAMAALAAAQDINCCLTGGKALTTATTYAADNPIKGQTVTMAAGYPTLKCLSSTGISCAGSDNANAIEVKLETTVPLLFGNTFGQSSKTIGATATASAKGGGAAKPLDIMIVLDTTASMGSSLDSDCSSGSSGSYTRLTCAEAGALALLGALNPAQDNVGLMVFPGVSGAASAEADYCSPAGAVTSASYASTPTTASSGYPSYAIVALPSSSSTQTSFPAALTKAFGGGGCAGLQAKGGYGTYYAGVVTAAQSALTAYGRTGAQKVIIFLSDGDANATSSHVPTGMSHNQCQEGIAAAKAATAAGTWVYTVAYGAPTSGSCSTDVSQLSGLSGTYPISACQAMQDMASSSTNFFTQNPSSVAPSSPSFCGASASSIANLITLFQNLGASLNQSASGPRLIPNGTT